MLSTKKIAALIVLTLTGTASSAAAHDFTCYPETDHSVGADAPNVFIMLDKSGSMDTVSTDGVNTRWEAATTAVSEVTKDMTTAGACTTAGDPACDEVRFGFGIFSGDTSGGAQELVNITEDANVSPSFDIDGAMSGVAPNNGSTTVGDAAGVINASTGLMDATRSNIAVLISDGGPSTGSCSSTTPTQDTVVKAVRELCDAKLRATAPVQTYSVGFGTSSSSDTNSLFAAAGGTGSCCLTSDCSANPWDPCAASDSEILSHIELYVPPGFCNTARLKSSLDCTGSIEATSPSDLKNALQDITASAQCSFPLDIPSGYPATALDDPDSTRVVIEHTLTSGALLELPYAGEPGDFDTDLDDDLETAFGVPSSTADPYEDEGWYFTDSSKRFVKLTPRLCTDLQSADVQQVKTQLACACTLTGPCTITGGGWTPTQLANMRCAAGEWQCIGGVETCVPIGSDQPEICNGLDDDCDGLVDNIKDSWEKPAYSSRTLPSDHLGVDCNRLNSCSCPNGMKDDHAGSDWDTFLDNWDPVCQCGGGLEAPLETPAGDGPAVHLDDQAACATGSFEDAAPFYLGFLVLAGLVTIRRRKL